MGRVKDPAPVTIVVPAYNRAAALDRALASIEAQTRAPAEVVVVDDGSTDGTADCAAGRAVRMVQRGHGGAAAARNTGIEVATQPWIAFLDSDDVWSPRRLEASFERIERRPDSTVAYGFYRQVPWGDGRVRVLPKKPRQGRMLPVMLLANLVGTSTVTARREVLVRHGLFDGRLPYAEDYELWLRLARRERFVFVPELLAHQRVGPSSKSKSPAHLLAHSLCAAAVVERFLVREREACGRPTRKLLRSMSRLHKNLAKLLRDAGRSRDADLHLRRARAWTRAAAAPGRSAARIREWDRFLVSCRR
ncbi:MAG: glycosyltransferase family 2 protein [Planctomycetota bacterium]